MVLFFVSGTLNQTYKMNRTCKTMKIKNTQGPITSWNTKKTKIKEMFLFLSRMISSYLVVTYLTISGANPSPTKKLAVQFVTTAIEVAIPRAD